MQVMVDRLIGAGLRAGKHKLSLAAQVLLFLMKLRKDYDFDTLAFLFNIKSGTAWSTFWRCLINQHSITHDFTPNIWSKDDLSNEEIDIEFDKIKASEDPFFSQMSSFFEDPQKRQRIPVAMAIDSTKLEVNKVPLDFYHKSIMYILTFSLLLVD